MGLLQDGWMILAALLPSAGLLYLFYVVMKHMVEGDRRERAALREFDRRENLKALPTSGDTDSKRPFPGGSTDRDTAGDPPVQGA